MNRMTASSDQTAPWLALTGLALGLALLAPGSTQAAAQTTYKIQLVAQIGDKIGDVSTKAGGHFYMGSLNDRGQLVFGADSGSGELLAEYTDGSLRAIVMPGQPSPDGTWPSDIGIDDPASINQRGDIVFTASKAGAPSGLGTYLWDDQAQKLTVVAEKGMPAVRNLTFQSGGTWFPAINNQEEIAFPAAVTNAAGAAHLGVFLRSPDGQIQAVALPDDPLPGGSKVTDAANPILNDAGLVGFIASRSGQDGTSAYLWENGTISPVLLAGSAAQDGGKITVVEYAWVNNQNRSILVSAQDTKSSSFVSLYLWSDGTLTPVAIPGQTMPAGGQLKGVFANSGAVSLANEAGEHAFLAELKDNTTAAYRMEPDGTLSLIVKSGTTTDLGVISFGQGGIGLNTQGQVALAATISGGKPSVVLLTPSKP